MLGTISGMLGTISGMLGTISGMLGTFAECLGSSWEVVGKCWELYRIAIDGKLINGLGLYQMYFVKLLFMAGSTLNTPRHIASAFYSEV